MKVRKFVPKDLKRVFEIENMSFDQSYGINMFQQLYDMGIGFLVAEKDDYVGAGTELFIRAITVLSMLPIDAIYLEVRKSNLGAVEFYEKFNFIKDRVVPGYYEDGDAAIIMYLPVERGKVSQK